ncbi:hypothetical protein ACLOJK_014579 [Asimina triloba]
MGSMDWVAGNRVGLELMDRHGRSDGVAAQLGADACPLSGTVCVMEIGLKWIPWSIDGGDIWGKKPDLGEEGPDDDRLGAADGCSTPTARRKTLMPWRSARYGRPLDRRMVLAHRS